MPRSRKRIIGVIVVTDVVEIRDMVDGLVTVQAGGRLVLWDTGTVTGGVDVHPGGLAVIMGCVKRHVVNYGGKVRIDADAVVWGLVQQLDGQTTIDAGATVHGRSLFGSLG